MAVRCTRVLTAFSLLVPTGLAAQVVRGTVTQGAVPISGVVVQMLDSASTVVARAISDETGAYRVLAPRDGRYRLTARRIGFSPVTSDEVTLRTGEVVVVPLTIDGITLSLDTVRVSGRVVCGRPKPEHAAVYAIWEHARTAMMATQASLTQRAISASLLRYRRSIDLDGRQSLQAMTMLEIDSVAQPWGTLSAAELRRTGYIVTSKDDSTVFHAPGLDLLASNEFGDEYCFKVVASTDSTLVGITFEPTRSRRGISDIRGTLWIDRASAELRFLEFGYTNVTKALSNAGIGGRLAFAHMDNGNWMVSGWSIRIPVMATRAVSLSRNVRIEERVASVDVIGGDLYVARRGADTLWQRVLPPMHGVVSDSVTGRPVATARVRIADTDFATITDAAGQFSFGGVMPGEYTLLINTPSLDSLGAVSGVPMLVSDSVKTLAIRVPDARRVLPAVCRIPADSTARVQAMGVLQGVVTMANPNTVTGLLDQSTQVVAQWTDSSSGPLRSVRATVDERGRYRLCGVPLNAALSVRAESGVRTSPNTTVRVAVAAPFALMNLALEELPPDQGVVRGTIVNDDGTPLDNVTVEFAALSLRAMTDARGEYRLSHIPAGAQKIAVRRLGYTAADKTIVISAGAILEQPFVLTRVATLDAVNTTASRAWVKDFDEHQRLGLGQFMTRDQLAKVETQRLGALVSMMRGARIVPTGRSGANLTSARGQRSITGGTCYAQIFLDEKPVYMGRPGEPVPDINEFLVHQIEAIEYFAGAAETPAKYTNLNSGCGVLVIHTIK